MNAHDTEVIAGILEALGYQATTDINTADVILINTCAIRENAENKVFSEIGNLKHLKKERPDILIGVCGCMSQEESVVNKILKIVSKCRYDIWYTKYSSFTRNFRRSILI